MRIFPDLGCFWDGREDLAPEKLSGCDPLVAGTKYRRNPNCTLHCCGTRIVSPRRVAPATVSDRAALLNVA